MDSGFLDDLTFEDLEKSISEHQEKEQKEILNTSFDNEKVVAKSSPVGISNVNELEHKIIKEAKKESTKETAIDEEMIRKFEQELKKKVYDTSDGFDGSYHTRSSNSISSSVDNSKCTASEAAAMLNVSRSTVYNMIKRGQISAYKKGNRYVVDRNSVDNYIQARARAQKIRLTTTIVFVGILVTLFLIVFMKIL